jgi:hypothetical protein
MAYFDFKKIKKKDIIFRVIVLKWTSFFLRFGFSRIFLQSLVLVWLIG